MKYTYIVYRTVTAIKHLRIHPACSVLPKFYSLKSSQDADFSLQNKLRFGSHSLLSFVQNSQKLFLSRGGRRHETLHYLAPTF